MSPTGAQPMVSGGLALTYNGELYNAPELRAARRRHHRYRYRYRYRDRA
ncbi:hypothetical protein [Streptomyces sp. NPDC004042]